MSALEKMVTKERAIQVARQLFPEDIANGLDCRAFYAAPGEPCPICAARNEQWTQRVHQVRAAMMEAFK